MEFTIVQILLVAVWAFICGIDQFNLLESLHRPIVSCTVVGAILGDINVGLVVGGTFEIITIGQQPVGGAQPPNPVLGGIMAAVFAVGSELPVEQAVPLAIPFALFGQFFVTLLFTVMSGFMSKADQYAVQSNTKGIDRLNYLAMAFLGASFAVVSVIGLIGGTAAGQALQGILNDAAWLSTGLGAAGNMMRFVGFAILLKIMMARDLWGWYFTGFAAATVLGQIGGNTSKAALILLAIVGITIALYDYNTSVKIKKTAGSAVGGGEEDGI